MLVIQMLAATDVGLIHRTMQIWHEWGKDEFTYGRRGDKNASFFPLIGLFLPLHFSALPRITMHFGLDFVKDVDCLVRSA